MREDEAIQIGRQAAEDARNRVGVDRKKLQQELEQMMETDPVLAEAFVVAGALILSSSQERKH